MDLSNPIMITSLLNSLNYSTNCTTALAWYKEHSLDTYWNNTDLPDNDSSRPIGFQLGEYANDTITISFLSAALPDQYRDTLSIELIMHQMTKLWEDGHGKPRQILPQDTGDVPELQSIRSPSYSVNVSWYERSLWHIFRDCVTPQLLPIRLEDLDRKADCDASAAFYNHLDNNAALVQSPSSVSYRYPEYSEGEIAFWKSMAMPHNSLLRSVSTIPRAPLNVSSFANDAVHAWYSNLFQIELDVEKFVQQSFEACLEAICPQAGFSGNPDIMGTGVLTAYMLLTSTVSLTVVYCALVGLPIEDFPVDASTRSQDSTGRDHTTKVNDWIQQLLELALFFLLAIVAARTKLELSNDPSTTYETYASSMAIIIIFVNIIPLCVIFTSHMPSLGPIALLFAIIQKKRSAISVAFLFASTIMIFTSMTDATKAGERGLLAKSIVWGKDRKCLDMQLSRLMGPSGKFYAAVGQYQFLFMLICLLLLWPLTLVSLTGNRTRIFNRPNIFRFISFPFAFAMLWIPVYLLLNLRAAMKEVAGKTWRDADFGFGQTVALVSWIPIGLQLVAICIAHTYRKIKRKSSSYPTSSLSSTSSITLIGTPGKLSRSSTAWPSPSLSQGNLPERSWSEPLVPLRKNSSIPGANVTEPSKSLRSPEKMV